MNEPIAQLLAIAASQVGVREATGKNDGAAVEAYLAEVGLGPGYAWCAAFLVWCFRRAGYKVGPMALARQWFSPTRRIHPDDLRPGDVFGIPNRAGLAHHVGLVEAVDFAKGKITTLEGNTNNDGSREGIGVFRRTRNIEGLVYARWT